MKQNDFKVGDRVKIYSYDYPDGQKATVNFVHESDKYYAYIGVYIGNDKTTTFVHYKQSRRLKKREWQEVGSHRSIGKHVRVYSNFVFNGIVNRVFSTNRGFYYAVTEDGFNSVHNDSPFHEKQCEIIEEKREPRRIWVCMYMIDKSLEKVTENERHAFFANTSISGFEKDGWTEFAEVRK